MSPELKAIIDLVQNTTGDAKLVLLLYFAKSFLVSTFGYGVLVAFIISAYKLLQRLVDRFHWVSRICHKLDEAGIPDTSFSGGKNRARKLEESVDEFVRYERNRRYGDVGENKTNG